MANNVDPRWPQVGTVDVLESSIGLRGTGKSTWQCYRALRFQRQYGGYIIGHSLGARLPTRLPESMGGHVLPIRYHDTIRQLARGMRSKPGDWHILAPPLALDGQNVTEEQEQATADALLKYGIELSNGIRKRNWERVHPFRRWNHKATYDGVVAPPVGILIDEGIAIESAGTSRKEDNRWFLQYLFSIRHYNIAMWYSIQDSSARSWRILGQSSDLWVFHMKHRWAIEALRMAGATQEQVDRIPHLQRGESVHIRISYDAKQQFTRKAKEVDREESPATKEE